MRSVKVLFFAADPLSAPGGGKLRLLLDEDLRQILEKVRAADYRDVLDFDVRPAARADDLLQALNEEHPQVVHFSGHGGSEGLMLMGPEGRGAHAVDAPALRQLFEVFRGDIRVVLLSACFSRPQAQAIAEVVGCAIGTHGKISDRGAITFNASFYRAIAFGHSVRTAYDQARAALALHRLDRDCPELVVRPGVDAARIVLIPPPGAPGGEAPTPGPRVVDADPPPPRGAPPPTTPPHQGRRAQVRRMIVGVVLAGSAVFAAAQLIDVPSLGQGAQRVDSVRSETPRTLTGGLPPASRAGAASSTASGGSSAGAADLAAAKDLREAGNHAAAFPLFQRAADAGNPEAMGFLGIAYMQGEGTARDPETGNLWLEKATSRARDPRAMNARGVAYLRGEGVNQSDRWARHWFDEAAKAGYADAMRNLGLMEQAEGRHALAMDWFQKSAQAGSRDARVDAGLMWENGTAGRRDPAQALRLYLAAANAGSTRGMVEAGRVYQDAVGVPRDYRRALDWFQQAAGKGSADAMNNIGVLYQNGWGVRVSREEAARWYQRAAAAGSTVAAGNLAALQDG